MKCLIQCIAIIVLSTACGPQGAQQAQPVASQGKAQGSIPVVTNPQQGPVVAQPQPYGQPSVLPGVSDPNQYQTCYDTNRGNYYQIVIQPDGHRSLWPSPAACDCQFFNNMTTCAVNLCGTQGISCVRCPSQNLGTMIGNCPAGLR
jgi:hypothetical protein